MRKIDLLKVQAVAFTCVFTLTQLSIAGAQAASGVITGSARSAAGAALSKIKMELLDANGGVTGSAVTAGDGGFSISTVAYGTYTVRCVGDSGRVLGTSSVTVAAPTVTVRVTCATETPAASLTPKKKYALLSGLAAAALTIGAVAVVATSSDASGAR